MGCVGRPRSQAPVDRARRTRQTIHHLMEDVGGDETIAQDFLSPLCPHGVIFSPPHIVLSIRDAVWKRL